MGEKINNPRSSDTSRLGIVCGTCVHRNWYASLPYPDSNGEPNRTRFARPMNARHASIGHTYTAALRTASGFARTAIHT